MAKGPGRDQRGPMERLVRIAAVLDAAGPRGVPRDRLLELAEFSGRDPASQLSRELRYLTNQGWQIDNIAPPGEDAVYAMTTVDNRLRVRLTPAQQTQLRRAALLADRDDLVTRLGLPDDARPGDVTATPASAGAAASTSLSTVMRAVRDRSVLRFGYKGTPRVVHPETLRSQNGVWYLRGLEEAAAGAPADTGSAVVKTYVVSRMGTPQAGPAGSAERVEAVSHTGLHPMTWEVDPPLDVVLRAPVHYEPDVRRWLGAPIAHGEPQIDARGEQVVDLTYRVTHREALLARLNDLGRRVQVVGPPEFRAELIDRLAAAAGVAR